MKHYSHPCFENSNYFHCFESEVHLCYSVQYERKWFFRYQFNWFSWHRRRVSATWGLRAAEWRIQFLHGVRDGFCRLPSGNVLNLREASIWETATVSRPVRSSSVPQGGIQLRSSPSIQKQGNRKAKVCSLKKEGMWGRSSHRRSTSPRSHRGPNAEWSAQPCAIGACVETPAREP